MLLQNTNLVVLSKKYILIINNLNHSSIIYVLLCVNFALQTKVVTCVLYNNLMQFRTEFMLDKTMVLCFCMLQFCVTIFYSIRDVSELIKWTEIIT